MIITELLEKNAALYGGDAALVEVNPALRGDGGKRWQEYSLIEQGNDPRYRRELTWAEFDARANRIANFLICRGVKKGDKVALLLMNCLEWLPVYFGAL